MQRQDAGRHMDGQPLAGQADFGLRRGQAGGKFRPVEEDQIVRAGAIRWRHVGDTAVERRAVTRHRTRQRDDLANGQAGAVLEEHRLGHATSAVSEMRLESGSATLNQTCRLLSCLSMIFSDLP